MKRKWWIIVIVVIVVAAAIGICYFRFKQSSAQVTINDKKIKVEVAMTESQRIKGLSGRDHLDADSGMLFVFPQSGINTFWMRDTKIPLDIIFINEGKVVEVTTLDPELPGVPTPSYTPQNPAKYVLEVNAGLIDGNKIKTGDKVEIKI